MVFEPTRLQISKGNPVSGAKYTGVKITTLRPISHHILKMVQDRPKVSRPIINRILWVPDRSLSVPVTFGDLESLSLANGSQWAAIILKKSFGEPRVTTFGMVTNVRRGVFFSCSPSRPSSNTPPWLSYPPTPQSHPFSALQVSHFGLPIFSTERHLWSPHAVF